MKPKKIFTKIACKRCHKSYKTQFRYGRFCEKCKKEIKLEVIKKSSLTQKGKKQWIKEVGNG